MRTQNLSTSRCSVSHKLVHICFHLCEARDHVLQLHSVLLPPDPAENVFFTLLNTPPIKQGDEVKMKCETDGNPQPQFEFTKDVRANLVPSAHMGSPFIVAHPLSLLHAGLYTPE